MYKLFSHDVYCQLDPGSTLFYMPPYVDIHFGFDIQCISDPFSMSTPVGDSIMDKSVYTGCVMLVYSRDTLVDLIELYMLDFDMILGMYWLYSCYISLDCRT